MGKIKIIAKNQYGNCITKDLNNPSCDEILNVFVDSSLLLGFSFVDIYLAIQKKRQFVEKDVFKP